MRIKKSVLFITILIVSCFGIFVSLQFLFAGWTPPTAIPPDGNTSSPLNASSTGQSKDGGLILNHLGGSSSNGLIVEKGRMGLGIINPTAKLDVYESTASTSTTYGIRNQIIGSPVLTANNTPYYASYNSLLFRPTEETYHALGYGAYNRAYTDGAYTFNNLIGAYNRAYSNSTATSGQDNISGAINQGDLYSVGAATNVYGAQNYGINYAAGTITSLYGSYNDAFTYVGTTTYQYGAYNYSRKITTGNIANAYGSYNRVSNFDTTGTGAITTGYGVYSILSKAASSTDYTTAYGYYGKVEAGATRWGIYLTGEQKNYFSGNIGIGTANPGAKLEVAGQVKITGGSPGAGKILMSDASGLASWENLSSRMEYKTCNNNTTCDDENVTGDYYVTESCPSNYILTGCSAFCSESGDQVLRDCGVFSQSSNSCRAKCVRWDISNAASNPCDSLQVNIICMKTD